MTRSSISPPSTLCALTTLSTRTLIQPFNISFFFGSLDYSPFGLFRPLQGYGMWDKGVTVVLEKRTSPGRNQNPGQKVSHRCVKQVGRLPPAGGGRHLRGTTRGRLFPGGGPPDSALFRTSGMGDDVWKVQKEGSVFKIRL